MKNIDLIDGYFQKNLSEKERSEFDRALANDDSFSQEFQELKEIQLGIKSNSRKEILSFLDEIESDIELEDSTLNNNTMKKMISVAASVVLIAAVSFFALTQNNSPSLNELYAENFTHYENLNGQVRGANSELLTLENQAYSAYDMGDYTLAAASFAELTKADKSASNYFYMGMSNLEANNYEEAIKNLNATINNFDVVFDKQAKWYLALAHMGNNDEDSAISSLVGLTLENSAYKEKAEEILAEMGLSVTSIESGTTGNVEKRPPGDAPAPNGTFEGRRQYQIGTVISHVNDYRYRFITDEIIDGLEPGTDVEIIVLRSNKKKKKGFAYLLGVL